MLNYNIESNIKCIVNTSSYFSHTDVLNEPFFDRRDDNMNNLNIEGINNINMVRELFSRVNGLAADNCFLVVFNRDYGTTSTPGPLLGANSARVGAKAGGLAGGIVGGAIGSAISSSVEQAVHEFQSKLNNKQRIVFAQSVYGGYLLNITPNGIGVIPLTNGNAMVVHVKNFVTDIDNYVFFSNDEISKMEIQKLPLRFSAKKLAIYFKGLENNCTPWTLPKKHKLISYQKDSYNKLASILNR